MPVRLGGANATYQSTLQYHKVPHSRHTRSLLTARKIFCRFAERVHTSRHTPRHSLSDSHMGGSATNTIWTHRILQPTCRHSRPSGSSQSRSQRCRSQPGLNNRTVSPYHRSKRIADRLCRRARGETYSVGFRKEEYLRELQLS